MKPAIRIAAVLYAVPLALGACGGDKAEPTAGSTTAAQGDQSNDPFSVQPGTEVDKAAFLKGTQDAMQAKKTFAMTMSMKAQGQDLKMSGQADMADPAKPRMKMNMELPGGAGQGGKVAMILDGQDMYMQMPGGGGKYLKMSIAQLTKMSGQDISKMMNPAENLEKNAEAINKITYVGEDDVAGAKLKHYKVDVDGQKAQNMAGMTQPPQATATLPKEMAYELWVDGDKLMRKMTMNISGAQVEMLIDKYGEPVDVQAPPAAQVTTMPGMPGAEPTKK